FWVSRWTAAWALVLQPTWVFDCYRRLVISPSLRESGTRAAVSPKTTACASLDSTSVIAARRLEIAWRVTMLLGDTGEPMDPELSDSTAVRPGSPASASVETRS